jgi:Fe-Mn family superoxide dismutase
MTITLTPLPYADTALAPAISAATLQTHHGLHHRAYVDNINAAIKGGPHAIASLATIISAADAAQDHKLFNDAAQAWNHGFYWFSLCADQQEPDACLAAAIERDFGSLALLKEELVAQGMAHFGSGWVWLVRRGTALSVEQTHDAASFAVAGPGGDAVPLLVVLMVLLPSNAFHSQCYRCRLLPGPSPYPSPDPLRAESPYQKTDWCSHPP